MTAHVNPVTLWRSLPAAAKKRLGALAIANELAARGASSFHIDLPQVRFCEATSDETACEIAHLVEDLLPDAFIGGLPKMPDLNKLGIRQCTSCGCTEDHACPGGCSWAGETLCTSCLPPAREA